MTLELSVEVALVTGGGRGIGSAAALALAQIALDVYACNIHGARLVPQQQPTPTALPGDVDRSVRHAQVLDVLGEVRST